MGSGTSTQKTDSQSVTQIPEWMNQAGQQNYAYAQNVAGQPLQQYQGQMVADTAPQTQQFWNVAAQSPSVGQSQYDAASLGDARALGKNNLSDFMNPYTQNVIDKTIPIMQQQNALTQNQLGNAASSAGAFGGSRQGVQQGVAQAQGAQNIGQMAAQLNNTNFNQATAAAQAKTNSDILASQGLSNIGTAKSQSNVANAGLLSSAGASQSMQAQNQINAQMAKQQQAVSYPQQQLSILLSALGMTPHDTATAGHQETQTTTPTNWAGILTGGLQAASGIFGSDKKLKKNITSLGKDPVTGVPIKSFQYKGAPANSPKIVGPLAQDVEKAAPGSTVKVNGVMGIPGPTLAASTPSVAHSPAFTGNLKAYMPGAKTAGLATTSAKGGARSTRGLANTKRKVVGALGG